MRYHPPIRPHRLVRSRTSGFHPGNRGSNPLGVALTQSTQGAAVRQLLLVLALLWLVPPLNASGPNITSSGDTVEVLGVIDQIDALDPGWGVWVRQADAQPILVTVDSIPEGLSQRQRIRAIGFRGDDLVRQGRDGRQRAYPVLLASEIQQILPGEAGGWLFWPLLLLVAVVLILTGRFGGGSARRASEIDQSDQSWKSLEPTDLPKDPAEALAVLAQRANEETT